MKKVVKIVVTVILLLMTVPGLALFAGGAAERPVLSWSAFGDLARESGWNDGVRQAIREAYRPLNDVSGVPAEVTNAFLEEKLTDEVCSLFWDETAAFPADDWAVDLVMRIHDLAQQMRADGELVLTDEEWVELSNHFGDTATYFINAARQKIQISGVAARLQGAADLFSALLPKVLWISGLLSAGSLLILALIHRRRFFLVGYAAFLGSGLLLLVPALWLKFADLAARLQLDPPYLKAFLVSLYGVIDTKLLLAGSILCTLGIVCGAVHLIVNRKKKGPAAPEQTEEKEKHDSAVS